MHSGVFHTLDLCDASRRLEDAEEELRFSEGGVVLSHRLHTMCEAGDCLIQVAQPIAE
jgi:predicted deacylase